MKKTFAAVIGALLLVLGMSDNIWTVHGQVQLKADMDQYDMENEVISVYVNCSRGDFQPTAEKSSLLAGKQRTKVSSIKNFHKTGQPVSYLLLADISGSMDQAKVDLAKSSMKQFVKNMGKKDTICVTTMGNDLKASGFLKDRQKLNAFIDRIQVTREDTNLYHSIQETLDMLKTDKAVNRKRCLVIFSDGADDQTVGITREEAEATVKESHIPVFTTALLKEDPDERQIENAKVLGSFARYSAGGRHFAPVLDGYGHVDVYHRIQKQIQNSFVITADLTDIVVGDETVYLEIHLSDGKKNVEAGMTVPAGKIAKAVKKEKKANEVKEAKETNEEKAPAGLEKQEMDMQKEPQEESRAGKKSMWTILAAVSAAVFLIVLALFFLYRKKSRDREELRPQDDLPAEIPAGPVQSHGGADVSEQMTAPGMEEDAGPDRMVPMAEDLENGSVKKKKISLYQMGPGRDKKKYDLALKGEVKIGRDKNCQLSMPGDTALSGIHCSITTRNGGVFVRDQESTNGTFVNGVPIVGEYQMHKDDILLVGSYEYRVYWE